MDDEIRWREEIEWQNIWWEQANNLSVKRIALLGDSVTRGFRSKLNERLGGKYVVDICASSSQITDPLLWKEFKFFLDCSEWKYSKIVIHAGGQHGHTRRCCEEEVYLKTFRSSYTELLKEISSYCPNIFIASYTPCVEKKNLAEWDDYRNEELRKRNQIIREVGNEFRLPYIDIWSPLMKTKFEYTDYIHMKSDGNDFISGYLSKYLV